MPDLNDVYRQYVTEHPPSYTDHMLKLIDHFIKPFRLTEITIWLNPDYSTFKTEVSIEARNLPGLTFRHGFDSYDFLDSGQDGIARIVAQHYAEWLNSLYICPDGNHELGEN